MGCGCSEGAGAFPMMGGGSRGSRAKQCSCVYFTASEAKTLENYTKKIDVLLAKAKARKAPPCSASKKP